MAGDEDDVSRVVLRHGLMLVVDAAREALSGTGRTLEARFAEGLQTRVVGRVQALIAEVSTSHRGDSDWMAVPDERRVAELRHRLVDEARRSGGVAIADLESVDVHPLFRGVLESITLADLVRGVRR